MDILVLFLFFRGNAFSFSPLSMMLVIGLSCMAFIMLRSVLSACFLKNFYRKSMLNFVKSFSCVYWDDHMVFILQFVNVVYHIDWFSDIETSCIPRMNPTWSWCMIFLMYCWIQIANILLRIFASIFISDIGLK